MKVLITGIAGFIGYHTALKFHREGYDVVGVDNYNDYYSPKLKTDRVLDLVAQSNGQIRTVGIDIKSKNFLDFMLSEKPDLVIHLAASAGVRDSLKEPIEYIENNITGTQHVINACEAVGIKNVIYATTSCVMHDCPLPWNEEHMAKHHLSPYGYTKATN
jgi:UDP-glucuronate 4-epimerase